MNHFSSFALGSGHDRRPEPRRTEPGRWPKAEAALALVNRDLLATLPGRDPLILMCDTAWEPSPGGGTARDQVYVAMADGRWHGNAVNACDLEEGDPPEPDDATVVLAVIADAAQTTVLELLRQVWPVCREHRTGTHPRPAGTGRDWYPGEEPVTGPPVWWCRGGQDGGCHDLAPVGELAATLPGKQRRALRRTTPGR